MNKQISDGLINLKTNLVDQINFLTD